VFGGLEIVVERMIERAFRRRGAEGRSLSQPFDRGKGFLEELRKIAAQGHAP
jgi:hypothetical protein